MLQTRPKITLLETMFSSAGGEVKHSKYFRAFLLRVPV